MDYKKQSLILHEKLKGKLEIKSKTPIKTKDDLSIAYTPGVAQPCVEISKNKSLAYKYTPKANSVAVVTDGSAVLGLGNIGPEASYPVMEGKAVLFKEFANIDAYPICIDSQDPEDIIKTTKSLGLPVNHPYFEDANILVEALNDTLKHRNGDQNLPIPQSIGNSVFINDLTFNEIKEASKLMSEITSDV